MEIELEDAITGQKWSPFQPKANSRQQLRAKQQEKIFLKRAERARKMKELGLVPDHNAEMGPSLEPDDRDDDFVPDQEDESDQENEQAIDDILQNDLAEVEADAEVPVDPEADEADYETIEDDTLPMEDDDEPEVELTEEEKAAKAEADALKAARLEEERIKREEEERKQREREAIQRRKEQILELRKMALEDRAGPHRLPRPAPRRKRSATMLGMACLRERPTSPARTFRTTTTKNPLSGRRSRNCAALTTL